MIQSLKFVFQKVENILGNGENVGHQHFLIFLKCPLAHKKSVCLGKELTLPNNKFLDRSKLIAFADDKLNLNKKSKLVLGRGENIVGKGKNAGYQHFLLFPQCFQNVSYTGSLKVGIV